MLAPRVRTADAVVTSVCPIYGVPGHVRGPAGSDWTVQQARNHAPQEERGVSSRLSCRQF
jgi:hypothetical protein